MNAEIEREKNKVISEWEQRAEDDLESAEIIFQKTDNYEIAVYHAHQAIEKKLKARLLKKDETFKFIHDLDLLFRQVYGGSSDAQKGDKISYVNSLYPMLRYPSGDRITKEQAEKSLAIAKEVFLWLEG